MTKVVGYICSQSIPTVLLLRPHLPGSLYLVPQIKHSLCLLSLPPLQQPYNCCNYTYGMILALRNLSKAVYQVFLVSAPSAPLPQAR